MKTRVMSTIIMLLIALPILIKGGELFAIFIFILAIGALKEIIDIKNSKKAIPFFVKLLSYISLSFLIVGQFSTDIFLNTIDYRLLILILIVMLIPITKYHKDDKYNINDAMFLIGMILFLGISFGLVILIRDYNIKYLILLLIISITSDTYAYIMGTLIGKHKLLENVSPKKSIEGTIFGVLFGTTFAVMYYYMVINNTTDLIKVASVIMLISIIGQLGDLCFSAIKRTYNKKDFSNLIPGHGGILDRLDSILFIILVFSLFINII